MHVANHHPGQDLLDRRLKRNWYRLNRIGASCVKPSNPRKCSVRGPQVPVGSRPNRRSITPTAPEAQKTGPSEDMFPQSAERPARLCHAAPVEGTGSSFDSCDRHRLRRIRAALSFHFARHTVALPHSDPIHEHALGKNRRTVRISRPFSAYRHVQENEERMIKHPL